MSNALTMAGRSLRLSARSPEALLTALLLPVMLMVVFVYLFGGAVRIGTAYVDYVAPQEHGNRIGLRWLAVSNGAAGVRFTPALPCEGSVSHFTPHDLFAATHAHQLAPRDRGGVDRVVPLVGHPGRR